MAAAAHVREPGSEPVEIRAERVVIDGGPGTCCACIGPLRKHHARLQRASFASPRQRRDAHRAYALRQRCSDTRAVGLFDPPLIELESAQPALVLRDDRLFARVPFEALTMLDVRCEIRFQCRAFDRRGQANHRVAITGIELGDDQELRLSERLRSGQLRATAAAQQILSAAATRLRDAIGIGECEQSADVGITG